MLSLIPNSLDQTLGTAACREKLLMSESVELQAVSVTIRTASDCRSYCSVKFTPFFSYTLRVGAEERECEELQPNLFCLFCKPHCCVFTNQTWCRRAWLKPSQQIQQVSTRSTAGVHGQTCSCGALSWIRLRRFLRSSQQIQEITHLNDNTHTHRTTPSIPNQVWGKNLMNPGLKLKLEQIKTCQQ